MIRYFFKSDRLFSSDVLNWRFFVSYPGRMRHIGYGMIFFLLLSAGCSDVHPDVELLFAKGKMNIQNPQTLMLEIIIMNRTEDIVDFNLFNAYTSSEDDAAAWPFKTDFALKPKSFRKIKKTFYSPFNMSDEEKKYLLDFIKDNNDQIELEVCGKRHQFLWGLIHDKIVTNRKKMRIELKKPPSEDDE